STARVILRHHHLICTELPPARPERTNHRKGHTNGTPHPADRRASLPLPSPGGQTGHRRTARRRITCPPLRLHPGHRAEPGLCTRERLPGHRVRPHRRGLLDHHRAASLIPPRRPGDGGQPPPAAVTGTTQAAPRRHRCPRRPPAVVPSPCKHPLVRALTPQR